MGEPKQAIKSESHGVEDSIASRLIKGEHVILTAFVVVLIYVVSSRVRNWFKKSNCKNIEAETDKPTAEPTVPVENKASSLSTKISGCLKQLGKKSSSVHAEHSQVSLNGTESKSASNMYIQHFQSYYS